MDRECVKAVGESLEGLRLPTENALAVTYRAHGPSIDCRGGFMSVTVTTSDDEQTSEAISLPDALLLVRHKIAAETDRRAKAKAKAATLPSEVE